jgi:hypothetical protein
LARTRKTVTVFGATGIAGSAGVDEPIRQDCLHVQVLARRTDQQEKALFGLPTDEREKRGRQAD